MSNKVHHVHDRAFEHDQSANLGLARTPGKNAARTPLLWNDFNRGDKRPLTPLTALTTGAQLMALQKRSGD
jgi:hypothetical protein